MTGFLIGFFTIILALICIFAVLIILMQRPSANAGMGSALGGGAAESAFGAESGNVLTRWTIYASTAFFVLAFVLYLAHLSNSANVSVDEKGGLPELSAVEETQDITPGSLTDVPNNE